MKRLRILTWHVHGNYLYSLTQVPHEFLIPTREDGRPGYGRLGSKIPWGANVREIPAELVRYEDIDCIVYQSRSVFEEDRGQILTPAQQALPCVYIEHDPPLSHPVNATHFFHHDKGLLVHVTPYNALMWDSGGMPTRVVDHGVMPSPGVEYSGTIARGITVINHIERRGRRLGADIYAWARQNVPLDLIGMESEHAGGLGEIANMEVQAFMSQYRYFFSPIRYTSLGLSIIEAMMAGVPVVGIAATELPTVIRNGVNGYVDNRCDRLLDCMRELLEKPELARAWGARGRETALRRFGMERYVRDWMSIFSTLDGLGRSRNEHTAQPG